MSARCDMRKISTCDVHIYYNATTTNYDQKEISMRSSASFGFPSNISRLTFTHASADDITDHMISLVNATGIDSFSPGSIRACTMRNVFTCLPWTTL